MWPTKTLKCRWTGTICYVSELAKRWVFPDNPVFSSAGAIATKALDHQLVVRFESLFHNRQGSASVSRIFLTTCYYRFRKEIHDFTVNSPKSQDLHRTTFSKNSENCPWPIYKMLTRVRQTFWRVDSGQRFHKPRHPHLYSSSTWAISRRIYSLALFYNKTSSKF